MGLGTFLLHQFARPSGWAAPLTARLLDYGNAPLNQDVIAALELRPGLRVLDVGFGGGGALGELLAGAAAVRVAGIDPSPEMVARARDRLGWAITGGRLEVVEGTVAALPWPAESFPRVMSVNSVPYWPAAAAGLREIARVLAPGGLLALAVRTKRVLDRVPIEKLGFHAYGEDELTGLFEDAGLGSVTARVKPYARGGEALLVLGRKA